MAKLFDDDKYFVDMKLKAAPGEKKTIFVTLCLPASPLHRGCLCSLPVSFHRLCFVSFSQPVKRMAEHDAANSRAARVPRCVF